ncbi:hypothetical protein [Neisseria sp.]|uniref:hypothetical protein n=1 Tax=Neisseria sp. TaxID=192066 RepID=UPI0035A16020
MKKPLLLLLLSAAASASPFPEETFTPVVLSGYGCHFHDDTGRQIMVSDLTGSLHFNGKIFSIPGYPSDVTVLEEVPAIVTQSNILKGDRRLKQVSYRRGAEQVVLRRTTVVKDNDGIYDFTGSFDYVRNGKRVYRGKITGSCGV